MKATNGQRYRLHDEQDGPPVKEGFVNGHGHQRQGDIGEIHLAQDPVGLGSSFVDEAPNRGRRAACHRRFGQDLFQGTHGRAAREDGCQDQTAVYPCLLLPRQRLALSGRRGKELSHRAEAV